MAVTENLYTGDGSTVLFSFTFPYLNTADVKVSLDAVNTTAYSLANATQVQLNSAPASGVAIRVYRDTDDASLTSEFFPGAAIKSSDLNNNFTQNLYVTQESNAIATKATTTATTASTNATSAITTANTASSNATTALNNSRESDGSGGFNSAISIANAASATATAAQNAVANALFYTPVANVSSIPGSPSDEDRIEISNSTGIESFSPLNGLPSGFTGSSDLVVRLEYDATNSRWDWKQYFADDPENRYLPFGGGTLTGALTLSGAPTANLHAATKAYVDTNFQGVDAGLTYLDGLNFTNEATFKAGVNLEIGVDVQAYDADTAKTDVAQTYSKAQRGAISPLTDASTVTPDFAASNNFVLTFTSSVGNSRTINNPSHLTAGQSGSIFLVQDGTGSRTVTWDSYWDWAGGAAPTLSTGANQVDRIDYVVRTTGSIHAVATLAYS